ncbi:MAG TPA: HIT family protein [Methanocorpusculum sp.]|nr:HIT family protein [Methanocorpusculum sp.]HJJ40455.1 HIT family protein [Methanocorpusculum sp.]HJJ56911.1 HIT family protein [Methanocorpusculum sp.]
MNCPFCEHNSVVLENELAYAKMDEYPVSPGHMLIISKRHISDWFSLTEEEITAILELLNIAKQHLESVYHPDGFNIGINCGEAAGQTIFHVHVHLIPRYHGDVKNPRGGVRGVIANKQNYPEPK